MCSPLSRAYDKALTAEGCRNLADAFVSKLGLYSARCIFKPPPLLLKLNHIGISKIEVFITKTLTDSIPTKYHSERGHFYLASNFINVRLMQLTKFKK